MVSGMIMFMKVAITGHRPEDLPNFEWVKAALIEVLEELHPELLIQGMAAGVDLMSAEAAYKVGVPYMCARPWAGHTPRNADAELYRQVLQNAASVVVVNPSEQYAGPWMYHNRNEYMVDRADLLIAVWSGKTSGGTAACVRYAKKKNVPILQINPSSRTVTKPVQDDTFDEPETLF